MKTRDIITSAGLASWTTFPEWEQLLQVAEAIEASIQAPISRAVFAARAAADLAEIPPTTIRRFDFAPELEEATNSRATPQGCTEIWGTCMEMISNSKIVLASVNARIQETLDTLREETGPRAEAAAWAVAEKLSNFPE